MKRASTLLLSLSILALVFYLGNFQLATSRVDSVAMTGISQSANTLFNEGFCVYPDSPFGNLVASELRARGHRVLTLSAPVECDGQFLAVWVEWFNVSYSPILARGQVRVVAIYSSAGDPSHYLKYRNATDKEKALMTFEGTDRPQFQAYIILHLSDDSRGIIGLRGYQNHLLREAVKATVDRIESLSHGGAG
ncbi:hypothetical protein [Thermococcus sp. MAR1]|uniref:hypothetical protein n=1 Tax=Thermococcus sp. MAR1 TaxID=1638263 RepID=UPI00143982D4|nr:hypothetical protein [Thermococcus sp. MAR1]NJE10101.1 hypothetical protein [Thermococcus sp. MAR1]